MRKIVFHLQTTLNNRIADANGRLWEPFPWGVEETAYLSEQIRQADTWALGRVLYETIVPYWDAVAAGTPPAEAPVPTAADREFAELQHKMTKIVFSTTLRSNADRRVIGRDIPAELEALKRQDGKDILLTCGPKTLAPIANTPGLVDEYLLFVNPAVLSSGPGVFDGIDENLTLDLVEAKVFDAGAIVVRYRVVSE